MEGIEVIFWVVLAIIWLISASVLRRRSQRERGRIQAEGEAYTAPEAEPMEMVEEEEAGEAWEGMEDEEKVVAISQEPSIVVPAIKEAEIVDMPELEKFPEVEAKVRRVLKIRPQAKELEIELVDLETLGRGILVSEILGPPRAKKPFRRIR